ncbi:MAG: hypothetical protein ACI9W6_002653 [Motiliproteus sp.]|jgi:hypothetical protein
MGKLRRRYLKTAVHPLGFSMLQLLVSGLLILVLVTLSYRQYMSIAADAERAAFTRVRGSLQAGVNLAMAGVKNWQNSSESAELEGSNSMDLLERVLSPPSNYLGELSGAAVTGAQSGNWYFDLDQRALYYHFRYSQASEGLERADNLRIGFRIASEHPAADKTASSIGLSLIEMSKPDSNPENR